MTTQTFFEGGACQCGISPLQALLPTTARHWVMSRTNGKEGEKNPGEFPGLFPFSLFGDEPGSLSHGQCRHQKLGDAPSCFCLVWGILLCPPGDKASSDVRTIAAMKQQHSHLQLRENLSQQPEHVEDKAPWEPSNTRTQAVTPEMHRKRKGDNSQRKMCNIPNIHWSGSAAT